MSYKEALIRGLRPSFGLGQILEPEELTVGKKVIDMHRPNTHAKSVVFAEFTIQSPPYRDEEGQFWVKTLDDSIGEIEEIPLADSSVVAYKEGLWNNLNWLKDPQKENQELRATQGN